MSEVWPDKLREHPDDPLTADLTKLLDAWHHLGDAATKQGKLQPERAAMLEKIGMEWEPPPATELLWDRSFDQARTFAEQHGHLRVPADHPIVDGINLYKLGQPSTPPTPKAELSPDRVARLTEIGMNWDKVDLMWEKALAEAAAYHDEHGTLDHIPHTYKTPSGFRLYDWAMRTRRAAAAGKLPADRLQQMIDLGMRFTPGTRS